MHPNTFIGFYLRATLKGVKDHHGTAGSKRPRPVLPCHPPLKMRYTSSLLFDLFYSSQMFRVILRLEHIREIVNRR